MELGVHKLVCGYRFYTVILPYRFTNIKIEIIQQTNKSQQSRQDGSKWEKSLLSPPFPQAQVLHPDLFALSDAEVGLYTSFIDK